MMGQAHISSCDKVAKVVAKFGPEKANAAAAQTVAPLGFASREASTSRSSSLSGHGFQPKPETNSQGSVLS